MALLVGLTLALNLPFLNQAFHIDDVLFLDIARNVPRHPLFPLDLSYVYQGKRVTMWGHTHPPLNSYLIAVVLFLTGGTPREAVLHAVYLIFPVLATVAFYFLARRFVSAPLLATAIFACVPVVVVTAHTLMADLPLLALWLCATATFVHWLDHEARRAWLEAGTLLTLTLAMFMAYQGLALVPLLALYAFERGRLTKRVAGVLSLPVLLLLGWQTLGYFHRGSAYAAILVQYLGTQGIWLPARRIRTVASTLGYIGGTIVLFPFLFAVFGRRGRGLFALIALGAGIAGVWSASHAAYKYDAVERTFFALCFAGGFLATLWVVVRCLEEGREGLQKRGDRDTVFLSLWFLGVLFYSTVVSFSGAARYLLPAVPPLILLLVRAMEASPAGVRRWYGFCAVLISCQLALALSLARADFELAGAYRQVARNFAQRHLSRDDRFLFSGEWEFHYYLAALGGEAMTKDSVGRPGELVVKSDLCLSQSFPSELDRSLEVVERETLRLSSPLRLLDRRAHAGFWSDGIGMLPFWFSHRPLDQVTVYRVGDEYRPLQTGMNAASVIPARTSASHVRPTAGEQ